MELSFWREKTDSKKINSIILDAILKKIVALIVFMKIYVYQTVLWLVLLMSQLLAVILHTEKATSSGKFPFAPARDKNLSVEEFSPTPFYLQVGHIASFLDFFKMRISGNVMERLMLWLPLTVLGFCYGSIGLRSIIFKQYLKPEGFAGDL